MGRKTVLKKTEPFLCLCGKKPQIRYENVEGVVTVYRWRYGDGGEKVWDSWDERSFHRFWFAECPDCSERTGNKDWSEEAVDEWNILMHRKLKSMYKELLLINKTEEAHDRQ